MNTAIGHRGIPRVVFLILAMACALSGLAQEESGTSITVPTASRSLRQAASIIDQAALRAVAELGYTPASPGDGTWRMTKAPGIEVLRLFDRQTADGRRTLEIWAARDPLGSFTIGVYGERGTAAGIVPNPEVNLIEPVLVEWTERVAIATTADPAAHRASDLGIRSIQLSYVQTDKALAVLKALGYTVVEYLQQPGESINDYLYSPNRESLDSLPVIIKMIDASKTSLLDPPPPDPMPGPPQPMFGMDRQPVPDIGGTFLHQVTAGEPQQRLLIVYDVNDTAPVERLFQILREEIDVPARQVLISALVVEVNSERLRDLGVTFHGTDGRTTFGFERDLSTGEQLPFTFTFDKGALSIPFTFSAALSALVERGEAEILSNPSVLVLDGRQARIQIGKQVPVVSSTSTAAGIISSVEYFPVGIVLNLRPRISVETAEVTMQVETIVSAVAQTSVAVSQVFFAPTIDNRQVQTFVRVADNTPFIIGGLISSDRQDARTGVPLLSGLPVVGNLFRRTVNTASKREVIVVLTPHIVPLDERNFSYLIPKDADRFDSFGHELFRNAYRIRRTDVFDVGFIQESELLQSLVGRVRAEARFRPEMHRLEPFASLLQGSVPGEEVVVRRMLWEIARRSGFGDEIDPSQMLLFRPGGERDPTRFDVTFLDRHLAQLHGPTNALVLRFDAVNRGTPEHPFAQPTAAVDYETIAPGEYERFLAELNRRTPDGTPDQWAIVLSDAQAGSTSPLDTLRGVLVLKQILALNSSLPLRIRDFYVGRQIVFPTREDVANSIHVIDHQVARLFYEVRDYYPAFEQEFNLQLRSIFEQIGNDTALFESRE
jgi:general secretion pathway protein D